MDTDNRQVKAWVWGLADGWSGEGAIVENGGHL